MRVLICGTINKGTREDVVQAVEDSGFDITSVVSNGKPGANQRGIWWAYEIGCVPCKIYDESSFRESEAVIALWDGEDRDTEKIINAATQAKKPCYVHTIHLPSEASKRAAYLTREEKGQP